MRRELVACAAMALLTLGGVNGCHRPSLGARAGAQTPMDSVEGVVRAVGVQGASNVVLATDDSAPSLRLSGAPLLSRVAGLRVAVVGKRDGDHFTVSRFAVVAANGVRAADGRLTAQGAGLMLVTPAGARYIVNGASPALRANLGHRVWIAGLLDGQVVFYGVID
ncbi:MAG TPA: hypothetical protein VGM67_16150 [Gemmatimonadaceae bacterium]|jgi:hypothetical protein